MRGRASGDLWTGAPTRAGQALSAPEDPELEEPDDEEVLPEELASDEPLLDELASDEPLSDEPEPDEPPSDEPESDDPAPARWEELA